MCVHHVLNRVGNDFTAWQAVQHTVVTHRDAIIHGNGIEFFGYATGSVPTAPDSTLYQTITTKAGMTLVLPGLVICGNGTTASVVSAYDATGSVLNIWGYVNRITVS